MKRFFSRLMDWLDSVAVLIMGEKPDYIRDWTDPRNAPPAFEEVAPHEYKAAAGLPCCGLCGGGSLNSIHQTQKR